MGKIFESKTKNQFEITEDGKLIVYILGTRLSKDIFESEARQQIVHNIEIFAGNLTQEEFNNVIEIIRFSTDKPTIVSFYPIKDNEEESNFHAYDRYEKSYRNQDAENIRHFPDNIFINGSLVMEDGAEEKYIKKRSL